MTLARRLVREYPSDAICYRTLSEAYDQIKKNAMESDDDKLVEEAIAQAIEAGQRALALNPRLAETRRHLDKLTDQLTNVKADRNAAVSSLP